MSLTHYCVALAHARSIEKDKKDKSYSYLADKPDHPLNEVTLSPREKELQQ